MTFGHWRAVVYNVVIVLLIFEGKTLQTVCDAFTKLGIIRNAFVSEIHTIINKRFNSMLGKSANEE
jgi:hypothetical protein